MMKIRAMIAATVAGLACSAALHAAVSAEEAARLGKDLTPVGAERAANADGSIPAWDGTGTPVPAGWKPGGQYLPDPFADDKPLYQVTVENMDQHADILTEGNKALLQRFGPQGYRMDVYPTRRNAAQPQWFYDGTMQNATAATLVADGQKIEGSVPGVPFPIPKSALEVVWNHLIRFQGYQGYYKFDSYYVDANGKRVLSTTGDLWFEYPMYVEHFKKRNFDTKDLRWAYTRLHYLAPARRAGEILLVHEPGADYTASSGREAWQYLTGQRRVRKAPAVSFDTPNPATAGTSTYDDQFVYNGSPERYDWKLIGKEEMLIPYNCYTYSFGKEVLDLLGDHFFKPEYIRWEKHRVWIVEGTLKAGSRHIYGKRRYYVDEDSWAALSGEVWDGEGRLWRILHMYQVQLWDLPAPGNNAVSSYDLLSGVYWTNNKPIPGTYTVGHDMPESHFSPQGMARTGIR